MAYGTAANTATQGNDSRVVGALAAATAAATYAPLASPTFTGTVTMPGGTINVTSIGATTPSTGAFTTLAASGSVTGAGFATLLAPYALSSSAYTLPAGTSTVLGGVKPDGQTITNSAGAISVTYGAAANTAVQGNDARVTGALAASTAASTYAPLASPTLTGVPVAPTATPGTNTTQLATTAFVVAASSSYTLPTATASVLGGVKPDGVTIGNSAGAISVTFGTTANTATQGNDARVTGALSASTAASTYAPLASPFLTGTPIAPTAAANTATTQIATTAYVMNMAALIAPVMDGTQAIGFSYTYARQDHVHPSDTSRAPLASPTFTGTPAAPTATLGTSTTQLATTAFVAAAAYALPVATSSVLGGVKPDGATIGNYPARFRSPTGRLRERQHRATTAGSLARWRRQPRPARTHRWLRPS